MTIALSITKPVHRVLADHGYEVAAHPLHHDIELGCALALHFGDHLTLAADGRSQLTLRAAVEIGAGDAHADSRVMHWTLRKSVRRVAAFELMQFNLEIDLFLAPLPAETLRTRAILFHHYLRALLKDARTMLDHQPVDSAASAPGPILRLEGRLIGDLFAGRSGHITANRAPMTKRHRDASRTACDWLSQIILPELDMILCLDTAPQLGTAPQLSRAGTSQANANLASTSLASAKLANQTSAQEPVAVTRMAAVANHDAIRRGKDSETTASRNEPSVAKEHHRAPSAQRAARASARPR